MKVLISVEKAINRGLLMIHIPILMIFLTTVFLLSYLILNNYVEPWFTPFGLIFGILFLLIYRNFAITKWRIWAYENVRNINELKQKARLHKLIGRDGNFFERIEIRSQYQNEKLKILEKRINVKDIFRDDISVPKETKIFYAKHLGIGGLFVGMFFLATGFYLLFGKEKSIFGLLPIIGSIFPFKKGIKIIRDKNYQILINSEGIKLKNEELISWKYIQEANMDFDPNFNHHGSHIQHYFSFVVNGNVVNVPINELNVNHIRLKHLLQVYRVRYEKENKVRSI
ncbi:hypothetical protein SAMN05660845_2168 [Flavobacterium swingsii]|jgi:hypothetical protein|uniref:Uncharacterized protein n=1 Tax=Flavobacterium swingsii TaxID=498292 RepID=A0A1I0ZG01_9FLAO|nr:hypothetical protein [Flavobacterium swingsii]SFB23123.1 hypothetical protein SAMN05660845_2168 [Flavobacterium swingsii]